MLRSLGLFVILTALGCATHAPESASPPAPVPVRIDVAAVPLNPENLSLDRVGDFRYAGGIHVTSSESGDIHGLSGLAVTASGEVIAVADVGIRLTARLLLDDDGRLVGMADVMTSRLIGESGQPLLDKVVADAEDFAVLPGGDALVSFEREARILRYPADGSPPVRVPSPAASFALNGGMEALTANPEAGPDAYLVGEESTGQTWACRLEGACATATHLAMAEGFGLTAMARLPGDRTAYLLRAYDPAIGSRITLAVHDAAGEIARMEIVPPMTVDNFEGLAAVPGDNDVVRFYLLSDDNVSADQRTLLLAFDWHP